MGTSSSKAGSSSGSPRRGSGRGARSSESSPGNGLETSRRTNRTRETVQRHETPVTAASFLDAEPTGSTNNKVVKPRSSCKLHCPPDMFLLVKSKPSVQLGAKSEAKPETTLGETF